jgi:vesicle coat complex subunit
MDSSARSGSQIVSLAIKRGCGDMSPHVRKAAALAIPKCYRLDLVRTCGLESVSDFWIALMDSSARSGSASA